MFTNEQIAKMSKAELTDALNATQAALPVQYRDIAATPATEAVIENGITVQPAKEAKPAISIREQLLAGTTYVADCAAIDAANEKAESDFKADPKTAAILAAKENAKKFDTDNAATFEKIAALQAEVDQVNAAMKVRGANLKDLKPKRDAIEAQIESLQSSIVFPADYDLANEALPTFTPASYPDIDSYFPNGISGNFPASFLLGTKKSPRAAKVHTPATSGGENPTSGNFKYLNATATATAEGLTLNVGSEVSTNHVASCPKGTIKLYNESVANGSIVAGKVTKPITGSWSAMASLVSGSSKAASMWHAA